MANTQEVERDAKELAKKLAEIVGKDKVSIEPFGKGKRSWTVIIDNTKGKGELFPDQVSELVNVAGIGGITGGKLWWVLFPKAYEEEPKGREEVEHRE